MARAIGAVLGPLVLISIAVGAGMIVRLITSLRLYPVVSNVLGVVAFAYVLRFLDDVYDGPLRRLAKAPIFAAAIDQVHYRYQRTRAAADIHRRMKAIEEEQRVRALTLTAKVHENAARAVSDGKLHLELEELKGRSEQVVMQSQSIELARAIARYQAALWQVRKARHMTAGEKARLLSEMRSILAVEGGEPLTPARTIRLGEEDELSQSAQPAVVLEYRAPGGQAVPVTVEGFRKLVERDQLKDDDECRRLGSSEWISVVEMRDSAQLISARAQRALDP